MGDPRLRITVQGRFPPEAIEWFDALAPSVQRHVIFLGLSLEKIGFRADLAEAVPSRLTLRLARSFIRGMADFFGIDASDSTLAEERLVAEAMGRAMVVAWQHIAAPAGPVPTASDEEAWCIPIVATPEAGAAEDGAGQDAVNDGGTRSDEGVSGRITPDDSIIRLRGLFKV